ncbi:FG-GAP-like repeat-containing protein [Streptomyces sp. NPDC006798]|uniref:FG-GAP-like repeat-containing protein n=1 Tax=Streptomyces sp. NPDC006798 TaxID=3155462 RepID=UPI0033C7849B
MRPGLSRSTGLRPAAGPRRTFHRVLAQALAGVMAAGLLTAGGLLAAAPSAQAAPAEPHTATEVYLTNVANGGMVKANGSPGMVTNPKGNEDHQQVRLEKRPSGKYWITRGGQCFAKAPYIDMAMTEMRACGDLTEFTFQSLGGERFRLLNWDQHENRERMLHSSAVGGRANLMPVPATPNDEYAWYVTPIDPTRQDIRHVPNEARTYDQMTYLTTHNSFWNDEDLSAPGIPAQPHSIRTQLNQDVRGLMLDVYDNNIHGNTRLCHGSCLDTNRVTEPILRDIVEWMNEPRNSREIVTIFLQDESSPANLKKDLDAVPGLNNLIFDPAAQGVRQNGWPTVGAMANAGKRLVIFSSKADSRQDYGVALQSSWTVENYWEMGLPGFDADWSCYTRWGNIPLVQEEEKFRRLFVMNHFRKYPSAPTAANDNAKLANRAGRFCMPAARKKPNFFAVDQYRDGNPMAAVNEFQDFTYHGDTPGNGGTPTWKAPRLAVMPLGDSITLGVGASTCAAGREKCEGYRKILRDQLAPHATELDFVGSQQNGNHADSQHEGHSGWMIDGILENIDNWLVAAKPNVITLHIGSNDINREAAVQDAPARLARLVNRITTVSPETIVLLAPIVPNSRPGKQPLVDAYNAAIPGIVAAERANARKVEQVDFSAITAADLDDGLHPKDSGYQKMADAFAKSLAATVAKDWLTPHVTVTPGPPLGGDAQGDYDVDYDGDGRTDYLVLGPNGALTVHRNNPAGGWTNLGQVANGSPNWTKDDVRFADVTGDGRVDYLVLGANGAVTAYRNDLNNQWTNLGQIANGSANWTKSDIRFADHDGDGDADYLVLGPTGATTVYRNDLNNQWTNLGQVANGSVNWTKGDVRFADVTGDGRADYLVLGTNGAVTAYRNDLNNQWTNLGQIANGSPNWMKGDVRFADYDGDGRADYLVLGTNGSVDAYRNDLNNQWTNLGRVATGSSNWTKADVRV